MSATISTKAGLHMMVLKVEAQRQLETFGAKKPLAAQCFSFSFWLIFPSLF